MTTQWFCGAVHKNINGSAERDRLTTAVKDAADQMTSYLNGRENHDFSAYAYNYHSYASRPSQGPSDGTGEWAYLKYFAKDLAQAHENGDVYISDGDVWIIFDGFDADYGYGRGGRPVDVDVNGDIKTIHVGRALALGHSATADPLRVGNNIIKHNIGHCMNVDHRFGSVSFGSAGNIRDISPMAQGYVRTNVHKYPDLCVAGDDDPPDTFCGDQSNFISADYCGTCADFCRHTLEYSGCSKEIMDHQAPL